MLALTLTAALAAAPTTPPATTTAVPTTTKTTETTPQETQPPVLTSLDIELGPRPPLPTAQRFRQRRLAWKPPPNSGTPLLLLFSGAAMPALTAPTTSSRFAFVPGEPVTSSWPTPSTPWLARDLDGDGAITSGRELFGSSTVVSGGVSGEVAPNGFVALAALDDNGDGVVDEHDAGFAGLLLWRDDGDRVSQPGELVSVRDAGIVSLSLQAKVQPSCAGDVCAVERAGFVYVDAAGRHDGVIVDLHLLLGPRPAL